MIRKKMKICTKCKLTKELTEFHIDNNRKDKYRSHCKECIKLKYNNGIIKEDITFRTHKTCVKCNEDKNINDFYINKRSKDNHDYKCKKCSNIKHSEYVKNNQEKIKKINEKSIIKNKNEIKYRNKLYYESSKGKERRKEYYIKNEELIKEKNKNFYKSEKGKYFSFNKHHKRRTLTKTGDVTTEQLLQLQKNSTHCYWCKTLLKNKKTHIDHYIPLSKGGEHTLSNLVVSCSKCNLEKHAKDPIEFANKLGRLL